MKMDSVSSRSNATMAHLNDLSGTTIPNGTAGIYREAEDVCCRVSPPVSPAIALHAAFLAGHTHHQVHTVDPVGPGPLPLLASFDTLSDYVEPSSSVVAGFAFTERSPGFLQALVHAIAQMLGDPATRKRAIDGLEVMARQLHAGPAVEAEYWPGNDFRKVAREIYEDVTTKAPSKKVVIFADRFAHSLLLRDVTLPVRLGGMNTADGMRDGAAQVRDADVVIVMGGCGVIDLAKASALGKRLVVVPTILSSNCICCNRAVIGNDFSMRGTKPERVIYPHHALTFGSAANWIKSGIGDYFATLSAYRDILGGKSSFRDANKARTPFEQAIGLLRKMNNFSGDWSKHVQGDGDETPERGLFGEMVEVFHGSGTLDTEFGTNCYRIGGEHDLYRALMNIAPELRSSKELPHGVLVAAGTLLSLLAEREQNPTAACEINDIYNLALQAFGKVGLIFDAPTLASYDTPLTRPMLERAFTFVQCTSTVGPSWLKSLPKERWSGVVDMFFADQSDVAAAFERRVGDTLSPVA